MLFRLVRWLSLAWRSKKEPKAIWVCRVEFSFHYLEIHKVKLNFLNMSKYIKLLISKSCDSWEKSKYIPVLIPLRGNTSPFTASSLWNSHLHYTDWTPSLQIAFERVLLVSAVISVFAVMSQWSLHRPQGSTRWQSQKGMEWLPPTQVPISGARPSPLMNASTMTPPILLLPLSSSQWTVCLSCTTGTSRSCDTPWAIPSAPSVVRILHRYTNFAFSLL